MLEIGLIIGAVVIVVIGGIIYGVWLNRKLNTDRTEEKYSMRRERRRSVKAVSVPCYIEQRCQGFYVALQKALPSNYIIFPNVSAELLFQKHQRQDLRLWGFYADFVVFTQSYIPILVIDMQDQSLKSDVTPVLNDEVVDVIKLAGISFLRYPVQTNYNIDEIRKAVAKAMNPLYT